MQDVSVIFLIIGILSLLAIGWQTDYKKSLAWNMLSATSMAVYLYLNGELLAAMIAMFATMNSAAQYIMPEANDIRLKITRNALAMAAAMGVSAVFYEQPMDLIYCLGFMCIRMGEAQGSAAWMRMGFVAGMLCYAVFGILNGLYLMSGLQLCIMVVFVAKALYRPKKISAE